MATPTPVSYSAPHGATCYGGRSAPPVPLPAWVPPPGTYVNISTTTLQSVEPAGWPGGDTAGPFLNWSSAVLATDFSTLGAYTVYGSGHLASPGAPVWAGIWNFDLDTLQWVPSNLPGAPISELVNFNAYGESTDASTLGHVYVPHTYRGLIYQSRASGGGAKGSLIRASIADGVRYGRPVHAFDLNSSTAPPTRKINDIGGNAYPMAAPDPARGGFWYLDNNGGNNLRFVKYLDWSVTTYPNTSYGANGDNCLFYMPAPYDCLIGLGPSADPTLWHIQVCPLINNIPQGWTKATMSGTSPSMLGTGACWSTILSCFVSYEGHDNTTGYFSNDVFKLTPPPAANVLTQVWVWTKETLSGYNGTTPFQIEINTNNNQPFHNNGSYGRFLEVPKARCFIWCGSVKGPVQAWSLSGMQKG